jgi:branched-chain amino acid aminotransferase
VVETSLPYEDFKNGDEIFSTGNFPKVPPVIRMDDRSLQLGSFTRTPKLAT